MPVRSSLAVIGITTLCGCFEESPLGVPSGSASEASTASSCEPGSLGCACFPNGTCDAGLACSAAQCEPFEPTSSDSTSSDSTSSDSTSSSGTSADGSSSESGSSTGEGPAHLLFTSATEYDGAQIGGLASADLICTELGQGLRDGPWVAVLRDAVMSIGSRITITGEVFNTVGERLAVDEAELLSGTLQNLPGYDERGAPISNSDLAWTGSSIDDCVGWSSAEFMVLGTAGLPTDAALWLDTETPLPCNVALHVYCISQ